MTLKPTARNICTPQVPPGGPQPWGVDGQFYATRLLENGLWPTALWQAQEICKKGVREDGIGHQQLSGCLSESEGSKLFCVGRWVLVAAGFLEEFPLRTHAGISRTQESNVVGGAIPRRAAGTHSWCLDNAVSKSELIREMLKLTTSDPSPRLQGKVIIYNHNLIS